MNIKIFQLSICCFLLILLTSCGYHNPYVYSGPDKAIYITSWKNRTSELKLDYEIYQSLLKWYQKSDSFKIVNEKSGADLILAGEIISIDLPSLSYGENSTTREVKLHMKVRYILKDLKTNEVLFEVSSQNRTEEYTITSDSSSSSSNESKALDTIIDELAQDIYLRTLTKLTRTKL